MDFVTWVFDKHYILSTIFLPGFSLFWSVYNGLVIRGIISFILLCGMGFKIGK